jgi:hypothetical protein
VAGFELNDELIAEELAHPRVLQDRRKALVQEIFEAKVISPHDE